MNIFYSHLNFENSFLSTYLNTQVDHHSPSKTPPQGAAIDVNGEQSPKKDRPVSGLDSLGRGNII